MSGAAFGKKRQPFPIRNRCPYPSPKLLTPKRPGEIFSKPCSSPQQRNFPLPLRECWRRSPRREEDVLLRANWRAWRTTSSNSPTSAHCVRIRDLEHTNPATVPRYRSHVKSLSASWRYFRLIWNRLLNRRPSWLRFLESRKRNLSPRSKLRQPLLGS